MAHGNENSIPKRSLINPLLSRSLLNIFFPARASEAVRLYTLKEQFDLKQSLTIFVNFIVISVMNMEYF